MRGKKKKSKKKKRVGGDEDLIDMPSSTKKLKDMKNLINENLSPIKADPDDGDFRLKMQPINTDLNGIIPDHQDSFSDLVNFPTP